MVDEAGQPLSPHALTSRCARMLVAAGVPLVRLHDARHTCGTLMHLEGVPIADVRTLTNLIAYLKSHLPTSQACDSS